MVISWGPSKCILCTGEGGLLKFSGKRQQPKYTYLPNYPTLPYPTLPYPTLPYPTLPYPTLPYPTLPYPTLPYPTLPYPTLPYPTLPYPTLPYPTLPYPTLPYKFWCIIKTPKWSNYTILSPKPLYGS